MSNISNSTFNPWLRQFAVTGFPGGIDLHGITRIGATYQLTNAQLKALQTTAVQLVAAPVTSLIETPPGGYVLFPYSLIAEYVFPASGTAFTIGNADNAFQIEYVGKTTALLSMLVTGLVDQTASTVARNGVTSPSAKISLANSANLGLEVKLIGTTPALTLGTGTVNLYLEYGVACMF
jgi:hypothetical protein